MAALQSCGDLLSGPRSMLYVTGNPSNYPGIMTVEDFTPEPGRDLGPLIHALRRHGGTLTFAHWVAEPHDGGQPAPA